MPSVHLEHYHNDGASPQARAVLALVQDIQLSLPEGAEACLHRWSNGREQGYTIALWNYAPGTPVQRNIVFYEHRSSDHIEIHTLDLNTYGSPLTLQDPQMLEAWTRSGVLHNRVGYGRIAEASNVIHELISAWAASHA